MNCRYCGAQNDEDAIFCGQCGHQLIDESTALVLHSPDGTVDSSTPTIADTIPSISELRSNELVERGKELCRNRRYEEAYSVWEEAMRCNPNNADAHYW